jgi:transcriptional regulator with XRE-family HTH domain
MGESAQVVPNGTIMTPKGSNQAQDDKLSGFSLRLVQSAESAGFNSARLAAEVEVTRGTMSRYWNGSRMFPADLLFRVAHTLGVNPRWLVTGKGNASPPQDDNPAQASAEDQLLSAFRRLNSDQRALVLRNAEMLGETATFHSPKVPYRAEPQDDRTGD